MAVDVAADIPARHKDKPADSSPWLHGRAIGISARTVLRARAWASEKWNPHLMPRNTDAC